MSAAIEARLMERGLLDVVDSVCRARHVPRAKVLGRDRHPSAAQARRVIYALLMARGLSSCEVGTILERDHSTVLTGAKVRLRVAL